MRRVLVVGSFPWDTKREIIVRELKLLIAKVANHGCVDTWCPMKRCTIGKLRFVNADAARRFLQARVEHKYLDQKLWVTVESTPEERARARPVTAAVQAARKQVEEEHAGADFDYDYNVGVIWVKGRRIWERPRGRDVGQWQDEAVQAAGLSLERLKTDEAAATAAASTR